MPMHLKLLDYTTILEFSKVRFSTFNDPMESHLQPKNWQNRIKAKTANNLSERHLKPDRDSISGSQWCGNKAPLITGTASPALIPFSCNVTPFETEKSQPNMAHTVDSAESTPPILSALILLCSPSTNKAIY